MFFTYLEVGWQEFIYGGSATSSIMCAVAFLETGSILTRVGLCMGLVRQ